jgi:Fe-S oxidoreductase
MGRIDRALGRYLAVDGVTCDNGAVTVTADGADHSFPMSDCAQGKCYGCATPAAVISDVMLGTPAKVESKPTTPPELAMLDAMSLPERLSFWRTQMDRCLRCYACRNACPMCVCRDHCISDTRDPHWMTQESTANEKLFYQVIHALHLAGRCTGCGECQRSCPVGIPILALRQQMARAIADVFDGYSPGMDPAAVPPLLGYEVVEKNIQEGGTA